MAGTILLLGSHGFAGTHFRSEAVAAGFEVVGTARNPRADERELDLLDAESVGQVMREVAPDAVVNLAGAASVAESWRAPRTTFEVNCVGALNLLEAVAAEAPDAHVLCVSSADVYGAIAREALPVAEDEPLEPINPYGVSKAAMEVVCGRYGRVPGLMITVARSFNHLGPGQSDRFAAPSFARQIAEAERAGARKLTLRVGDVNPVRDFTDVRDTVRAYRLLLEGQLTGTYNICSARSTRLRALIEMLESHTPLSIELEVADERLRPNDVPVLYGSSERLRAATGWEPTIPLTQSIGDLLEWWRRRLAR